MIIEFELQGSTMLHKGIFETTGFWIKYEPHGETFENSEIEGWKLYSHISFCFYHKDRVVVDEVYNVLIGCLRGSQGRDIPNVGFIRKLNN